MAAASGEWKEEGGGRRRDGRRVGREMGGGWQEGCEERQQERRPVALWGGRNPEECPWRAPGRQDVCRRLCSGSTSTLCLGDTACSLPSAVSPSPGLKKPPCPGSCQLLERHPLPGADPRKATDARPSSPTQKCSERAPALQSLPLARPGFRSVGLALQFSFCLCLLLPPFPPFSGC